MWGVGEKGGAEGMCVFIKNFLENYLLRLCSSFDPQKQKITESLFIGSPKDST